MKYIFEFASAQHPPTHPHAFTFSLYESKNGWPSDNLNFKTGTEWLDHIERKILLMGISDVFCMARTPDTENKEVHKFTFYFTNSSHCLQFQAAAMPNIKGNFVRKIGALNDEESLNQETSIRKFFEENQIEYAMTRLDARRFIVTTSCKHDDLILAIYLTNRNSDKASLPANPYKKIAFLLASNENV